MHNPAFAENLVSGIGLSPLPHQSEADFRHFLAMLAHELRNPLAAIRSALEITRLSEISEGDKEWAKGVVDRESAQMTRLVDDLLDVSRLALAKVRLERTRIDAATILDQAVEAIRPLISARGHTLTAAYGKNLTIEADPVRIEQIVTNLLTNAVKYTPAGGRIRLKARRIDSCVTISVCDTGIGIPPEKLSEMFEPFAQGKQSLSRSDGGLGLGLTIVRKLTELHGGTVTAWSDGVGKGCEFTVKLPAADAGAVTSPKSPRTNDCPRGHGLRVLIVDDNQDAAEGLARLLRHKGHTVETAYEGCSAIEKVKTLNPEAVLLDLGLPGMDDYELIARLRHEPHCEQAKFIAISGYGQEDDRRHTRDAGFQHHLLKPVDHDVLDRILRCNHLEPIDGETQIEPSITA
jgi:CheY-like chemotaxis protein